MSFNHEHRPKVLGELAILVLPHGNPNGSIIHLYPDSQHRTSHIETLIVPSTGSCAGVNHPRGIDQGKHHIAPPVRVLPSV